ncbi:MAG TPA: UDP-2,3-diacylglucosamine diphosphatase [Rhodocyclaceae bacterium]|nr:UDP-2,3-diacylglucosamine diphosphatase [Rhodocyclaceae bacterium]
MSVLFVADLHLSPARPAVREAFLRFLDGPCRRAEALYVLGDLFEYWTGDEDVEHPFAAEVCAALAGLANSGVPCHFLHGNRDFLAGERFARAGGLTLLPEEALLPVGGVPTLLMHGDTLCTDDLAYQQFRAQVRNPAWQQRFLALPAAERRRQAEQLRQMSEDAKSSKSMEIMDVNRQAVEQALRRHGYPRLIHGHTHRPARHLHEVDGRTCERWVLADWYARGSYLACDTSGCYPVDLD